MPFFLQFQSALPRGERRRWISWSTSSSRFQSALPRGERHHDVSVYKYYLVFQSALPRGERQLCSGCTVVYGNFNPRSREGSDRNKIVVAPGLYISIRAPARGATGSTLRAAAEIGNFNPRSREGSDAITPAVYSRCPHFNPRSREGSDLLHVVSGKLAVTFQSALPRGERRYPGGVLLPGQGNFNPRSREGSDNKYLDGLNDLIISIRAPARGAT